MRTLIGTAVLVAAVGAVGCSSPPTITEGEFNGTFTLAVQRGAMDVVVRTSGPAKYKVSNYSMNHPMGPRPDTEATFTTPAGTFAVSNKGLTEPGLLVNGVFYAEPQTENRSGRAVLMIDAQGNITVQPPKEAPAHEEKKP